MSDYIAREAVLKLHEDGYLMAQTDYERVKWRINNIPAADVLPRDEAIKMGAELAAMHGSDATSQQLEEAYLEGVEDGMTRRDVRPVVRGKWIWTVADDEYLGEYWKCNLCGEHSYIGYNYCPNCGARMDVPDMDFGERDGDGE